MYWQPALAVQETNAISQGDPEVVHSPAKQALANRLGLEPESIAPDQWGSVILTQASAKDVRIVELLAGALPPAPPKWLMDIESEDHYLQSLRLALAERLHFVRRYADLLTWTEEIDSNVVYSPELLAYLRIVAMRQRVDYEATRKELENLQPSLLENISLSRRAVLQQIIRESAEEDPKGLEHIARLMEDAQRRLVIHSLGKPTQTQQQRAIDDLDELIKKHEEQQKQMQQAQSSGAGGGASPAEESRPSDFKAPGEVDRKRLARGDSWGDLPPAERKRLTQEITRNYPARYRTLIGEYFEALATPGEEKQEGLLDQEGPR